MPTVKRTRGQSVEKKALPGARLTARANPDAFGAGIGNGLSNVAGVLEAESQRADNVAFVEADGRLSEAQLSIEMDAINRKGKDSFDLPNSTLKDFDDRAGEIERDLSNDRQKNAFRRSMAGRRVALDRKIQTHVAREIQAHDEMTTQAYLKNSINAAIEGYEDPDTVDMELARQVSTIRDHGARNGLPADEVSARAGLAVSGTHAGVIERMLANGKDLSAKEYLELNREEVIGQHLAKIEKAVEAGSLRGESQRKSDEIVSGSENRGDALEKARAISDPDIRDATVERVSQFYSRKKLAEEEARKVVFENAGELVEKSGTVDSIPPGDWAELKLTERVALKSYSANIAKGKAPRTDWGRYTALREQAVNEPDKFVKGSMLMNRAHLADSEYKELIKLQMSIANGDDSSNDVATLHQQISAAHNQLDFRANDREKKGRFNQVIYQAINSEKKHLKRDLNFDERQKVIDKMMIKGEIDGFFISPDKRFYEVVGTNDQATFEVEIPDDERTRIEEALKRHNRAVTDENVAYYYGLKHNLYESRE